METMELPRLNLHNLLMHSKVAREILVTFVVLLVLSCVVVTAGTVYVRASLLEIAQNQP